MNINELITSRAAVAELSDAQIKQLAYAIKYFSPNYLESGDMLHFWKIIPELNARLSVLPALVVKSPDFSFLATVQLHGND